MVAHLAEYSVQMIVNLVAVPTILRNELLRVLLQSPRRRPLNPIKGIPTALRAYLPLESEARPTALALVWIGLVTISPCECRFNASKSAHCNPPVRSINTSQDESLVPSYNHQLLQEIQQDRDHSSSDKMSTPLVPLPLT